MAPDKHVFKSKLTSWRKKSPLRRWRERMGLDINTAAYMLGVSFSSYQKWDYGNGHPLIKNDGKRHWAQVNVARPDQDLKGGPVLRDPKDWDAHMGEKTGVTLHKFMTWYHRRPTP